REVYYWLMNGGAIRLGKGGVFAPAGTPPRLMADYSGDGRADVLLANTQELWMLIATAGGSFTNQYVAPYPAGWN
ncbi:VCBS repeat-containing protein, partial [Acinetobacter baumannii]